MLQKEKKGWGAGAYCLSKCRGCPRACSLVLRVFFSVVARVSFALSYQPTWFWGSGHGFLVAGDARHCPPHEEARALSFTPCSCKRSAVDTRLAWRRSKMYCRAFVEEQWQQDEDEQGKLLVPCIFCSCSAARPRPLCIACPSCKTGPVR